MKKQAFEKSELFREITRTKNELAFANNQLNHKKQNKSEIMTTQSSMIITTVKLNVQSKLITLLARKNNFGGRER